MKHALPALAVALMLAGCGTAQVASYPVPPPLPPDTRPLPPVSDQTLVWRPGDWQFVNGSYVYMPGAYIPAAGHGPLWTPGHWAGQSGAYYWVPGGWV